MNTNHNEPAYGLFATGTSVSQPKPWFISIVRQMAEFVQDRRNRKTTIEIGRADHELFVTGVRLSEAVPWFYSLRRQICELREERRHPQPKFEITARKDPAALEKLIEPPTMLYSLLCQIR